MKDDDSIEVRGYTWPGVDGYQVYRATAKKGKYVKIATTEDQIRYIDKNVKIGKVYYYKYRAYKISKGKKIFTNFSLINSIRMTLPQVAVQNVQFYKDGSLKITYDKLKHADGYRIYDKTGSKCKAVKTVKGNINEAIVKFNTDKNTVGFMVKGYVLVGGKKYFGRDYTTYYYYSKNDKYTDVEITNEEELQKLREGQYGESDQWIFNVGAVSDITISNCKFQDAEDLKFLELCKHLKYLRFRDCEFKTLDVLDYLDKSALKVFLLENVPIESLDGIENFKNLEHLILTSTKFKSIDKVSTLSKLKTLSLKGIEIESFQCLKNLKNLEQIDYSDRVTVYDSEQDLYYSPYIHLLRTNYKEMLEVCKPMGVEIVNEDLAKTKAKGEEICDTFISGNITSSMSDAEKLKEAHDFIVAFLEYDHAQAADIEHFYLYGNSWNTGKGICSDYANCFRTLAERMGIYCDIVISNHSRGHAWNIVQLDGQYYHIDCTWDDSSRGVKYDYFLISDAQMNANRYFPWDTSKYPACTHNYYES